MDAIERHILEQVADLHEVPEGAYNIRYNGKADGRRSTANIDIVTKTEEGKSPCRYRKNSPPHLQQPYRL